MILLSEPCDFVKNNESFKFVDKRRGRCDSEEKIEACFAEEDLSFWTGPGLLDMSK